MEILVTENLRKYYQLGDATVRHWTESALLWKKVNL